VFPNESVQIQNGLPGKAARAFNLMIATKWVNELLALKGKDNAELQKRVNDLLAELGQVKVSELYDEEIRSLGDHCLIPLSRYLQSSRSSGAEPVETERRRRAARIVSDLAKSDFIPELIQLLSNPDPEVRASIAGALQRLTGENQGVTPQQWRGGADPHGPQAAWQAWWEANRKRIEQQRQSATNDAIKT